MAVGSIKLVVMLCRFNSRSEFESSDQLGFHKMQNFGYTILLLKLLVKLNYNGAPIFTNHQSPTSIGETSNTGEISDTSDASETSKTSETNNTGETSEIGNTADTGDTGKTSKTGETGDTTICVQK